MEKTHENPLHINIPKQIYIGDGHPDCELSNSPLQNQSSSMDEFIGSYCGGLCCVACFRDFCMTIFS